MPIHRYWKLVPLNVAAFFLFVVAVILGQQPLLYLMAAVLFLLPLISCFLAGRLTRAGLACERRAPASCRAGERIVVVLNVSNAGRLPKFAFEVEDPLPHWLRRVEDDPLLILSLEPGETGQASYALEADKRGVYALGPARLLASDPMGLSSYTHSLGEASELVVYPTPIPISRSFLEGASSWGWREQANARTRGAGMDFHGVREYQSGDELRRVHWRTTARTGRLAVTEYTQGFMSDAVVALDLNRDAYRDTGEGQDSALECAVTIAVTVCDDLLRQGNAVRLLTPQTVGEGADPTGEAETMTRILNHLARAQADSPLALPAVLQAALARAASETTLVYITPDAGNPALAAVTAEFGARGARVFGFALDAASFGAAPAPGAQAAALPGIVQPVRHGDNLQHVIEGLSHVPGTRAF